MPNQPIEYWENYKKLFTEWRAYESVLDGIKRILIPDKHKDITLAIGPDGKKTLTGRLTHTLVFHTEDENTGDLHKYDLKRIEDYANLFLEKKVSGISDFVIGEISNIAESLKKSFFAME
jgi:hypothetical protein